MDTVVWTSTNSGMDFNNPEEMRQYIKKLNDYFSLVGRPRLVSTIVYV